MSIRLSLLVAAFLLGCAGALAQPFNPGGGGGSGGSISGGWNTAVIGTPISATTSSSSTTVTGSSSITEVMLTNVGANGVYCGIGATATASYQYIAPSGGWFVFQIASGSNTVACITPSSTTTVNVQTGSGLATGTGGGGSSGGGAVTAVAGAFANGWSPDIGNATTATPWTGSGTPSELSLLLGIYANTSVSASPQPVTFAANSHSSVTALANNLVAKNAAGTLFGFYCNAIAGGAAGYCIAYNGASAPGTGALTGANVLDACYFDTTARGCSLSRIPIGVAYGTGIVILVSSAVTPFTYTTGVDTAFISADYQ
jgi:hypothetical protein